MKWFKHYSNAHTNQFLQSLLREKNGHELYAFYWLFLEFLCGEFRKDTVVFHASIEQLKAALRVGQNKKVRKVLAKFSESSGKFPESLLEVSETSENFFEIKTSIILDLMGKDFKRTRQCRGSDTPKKENKKEKEKKEKKDPVKPESFSGVSKIIDYLNQKCGTKYRATTESTKKAVAARLSEFTIHDLKTVIDKKHAEWFGTEMEKHLNPTTLFRPGNFERYLNQKIAPKSESQKINGQKIFDAISRGLGSRRLSQSEIDENFDAVEWGFIQQKGGLVALSRMSERDCRRLLGI